MNVQMIKPCEEYLEGYLDACREFKREGIRLLGMMDPDTYEQWKDTLFDVLENNRLGRNLKPGYVPASAFWLVEDRQWIGMGSVRHRLTPALEAFGGHIGYAIRPAKHNRGYGTLQLALLLREAYKLGIDRALLTCDETNTASARVMEKNGGVLWDITEPIVDGQLHRIKRYWIDTAPANSCSNAGL